MMLVTIGLFINDADARRFGGGRSFGLQRSVTNNVSRVQPMQMPRALPNPASSAKKWLGPLAGLAAGGLLATLLMGHGIGSGILSWLAIAGVLMFVFSLFRNRFQSSTQPPMPYNRFDNTMNNDYRNQFQNTNSFAAANTASTTENVINYPVGFDAQTFLREAKVQFIRLQSAFDSKNLNDLREFTSPEVFADIQLQIHERGDKTNFTDVVTLEAELLEALNESQGMVASVRFSGTIREDFNAPAEAFSEVWHFRKDTSKPSWFVAGVQQ